MYTVKADTRLLADTPLQRLLYVMNVFKTSQERLLFTGKIFKNFCSSFQRTSTPSDTVFFELINNNLLTTSTNPIT